MVANAQVIHGQFRLMRRMMHDNGNGGVRQLGGIGGGIGGIRASGGSPHGGGGHGGHVDNHGAGGDGAAEGAGVGVAELVANPKDLFTLWDEYQNGIGHRKAARLFTPQERGRQHVLDMAQVPPSQICLGRHLSQLVRANVDYKDAIDRISTAYDGLSLTRMIDRIKLDKKNNTLPPDLTIGQPNSFILRFLKQ
jgi:hypothetical protein